MVIGLYPCTCDYVAIDALVTISLYECFYYDFIQLWIIYKHLILKSTHKHMMHYCRLSELVGNHS